MKLELQIEVIGAEYEAITKGYNEETGEYEYEQGEELAVLNLKPIVIKKTELYKVLTIAKNWLLPVEVKE